MVAQSLLLVRENLVSLREALHASCLPLLVLAGACYRHVSIRRKGLSGRLRWLCERCL